MRHGGTPAPWDCTAPSTITCPGVPEALPEHPKTPPDDLVVHLRHCRHDFLSVLACMRARCLPAHQRFAEMVYLRVVERRHLRSIGFTYGVFDDDLMSAALGALARVLHKAARTPKWSPEHRAANWPVHDPHGGIKLIDVALSNSMRSELRKTNKHRLHELSVDPIGPHADALDGVAAGDSGAHLTVDPLAGYTHDVEPYVVDTLQDKVVSPATATEVAKMLERLSVHISGWPEPEQRMMWTFLRDWSTGGSARSAIVAVFGTTSGGNPRNHTANNQLLNGLKDFVTGEIMRAANDPDTSYGLAHQFAHAIHTAVDEYFADNPDNELVETSRIQEGRSHESS